MAKKDGHEQLLGYDIILGTDGKVHYKDDPEGEYPCSEATICSRDDGPDAWADDRWFDGPAWIADAGDGHWRYYPGGVKITGYEGLDCMVVNIGKKGLNVTHCTQCDY